MGGLDQIWGSSMTPVVACVSAKVPLKHEHLSKPETLRCTVDGTWLLGHGEGGGPLEPPEPQARAHSGNVAIAHASQARIRIDVGAYHWPRAVRQPSSHSTSPSANANPRSAPTPAAPTRTPNAYPSLRALLALVPPGE